MQKITPCLWFDNEAEEAAQFYTSVFPDGKIVSIGRYGKNAAKPEGSVLIVEFELQGQRFTAINGGPTFTFSEAISFQVDCQDQAETDFYWDGLLAGGGEESQCGWLKDRFGLSWQVVPAPTVALLADPDEGRRQRAWDAIMTMKKVDIAAVQRAADGVQSPAI